MLEQLKRDFNANPNLRIGAALIVSILWLSAILDLRTSVVTAKDGHLLANKQLAKEKARQVSTGDIWKERKQEAEALSSEIDRKVWNSPTIGVAQASVQEWLNRQVEATRLTRATVQLAEESAAHKDKPLESAVKDGLPDGIWRIRARIEADFDPVTGPTFLAKLTAGAQRANIDALTIRKFPTPRMEIELSVFAQDKKSSAEATAAPFSETE